MEYIVLKPFAWCADGFTRESLKVGDKRDFGSLADGLAADGYIGPGERTEEQSTAATLVDLATENRQIEFVPEHAQKRRGRK